MILDYYFKRPIVLDLIIAIIITTSALIVYLKEILILPSNEDSISILTDVSNISLTMSGFVLTLLTVLITFKSGTSSTKLQLNTEKTLFELFFSSNLYFETVKLLKNCIKEMIFISVLGFSLKLFLLNSIKEKVFFYNVFGLTIIVLSLSRCLLILGKILEFQKNEE